MLLTNRSITNNYIWNILFVLSSSVGSRGKDRILGKQYFSVWDWSLQYPTKWSPLLEMINHINNSAVGARASLYPVRRRKKLMSILNSKSITITTEKLIPAIHTYLHHRHIHPFKEKLRVYSMCHCDRSIHVLDNLYIISSPSFLHQFNGLNPSDLFSLQSFSLPV